MADQQHRYIEATKQNVFNLLKNDIPALQNVDWATQVEDLVDNGPTDLALRFLPVSTAIGQFGSDVTQRVITKDKAGVYNLMKAAAPGLLGGTAWDTHIQDIVTLGGKTGTVRLVFKPTDL